MRLSLLNWADNGSLIQHLHHHPPPNRFYHSDHCPVVVWGYILDFENGIFYYFFLHNVSFGFKTNYFYHKAKSLIPDTY